MHGAPGLGEPLCAFEGPVDDDDAPDPGPRQMRHLAQPSDIAAAVAFFASDATDYITGQTLSVSGGLTMA